MKIFLAVVTLLILGFLIFITLTKVGDNYAFNNQPGAAKQFYVIAKSLNPWDSSLDGKILAQDIALTELTAQSGETDLDETQQALKETSQSNVLGATTHVPVLMYHYIRVNPVASDTVGYSLSVSPSDFTAQMDYLSSHGYHTVSLDELGGALFNNASLPSKPIVITFDDGYQDLYTVAYPILRSHGMKGVSFVITGVVGAPNYLTWDEINDMKNSGVMTFGAHTVTHRSLITLDSKSLHQELAQSRDTLKAHIGYNINWMAYPYGFGAFSPVVRQAVKDEGYVGAFGTHYGTYQSLGNMYSLPRVRVSGGESVKSFASSIP